MSVIGSNILAGASGQGGDYTITRSLRFRSSASAHLTRTFSSVGNRKTWTWSGWVKLGVLTGDVTLFSANASATSISFTTQTSGFNFAVDGTYNGTRHLRRTSAVYRDPSAWYHVVVALDTTQATNTNRIKAYINGVQVSLDVAQVGSYPDQNSDGSINNNIQHCIGERIFTDDFKLDGYLAEVNFIDGQALTPSSFGATNASTGVWQPKKYAGTYGTNGFYLPFTNNSTTTTLGNDFSGNGNNWTTNNISLTAGSTYDSMTDVPTLTSATASNFAVMNPLDQAGGLVFSEANLRVTAATGWDGARATFSLPSTGKYYWETTCISRSSGASVGLLSTTAVITGDLGAAATGYVYNSGDGNRYNNGSASSYGATWGTNDIIGISWDADTGTLVFYKNGTSQGTAWTGLSGTFSPAIGVNGSDSMNANFGQRPFAYTPPTGFVALNTFNLPTPTIGATASTQANKYFNTILYTGTGSTRTQTGVGFQPDFTWVKRRDASADHGLMDAVRGASNRLQSNLTAADDPYGFTAFASDGFTFNGGIHNDSGWSFVAWNWKANGSGSTNTAGSITSTVSANTSAGFSVVTYTLNNSTFTVGHGLGVAPKMIMVKNRDAGNNWDVYHASLGAGVRLKLNSTDSTNSSTQVWNNTAPTSTVFSGDSAWWTNPSTSKLVAYCFAEVAGYSAFGKYTGNGSSDGTFVYTGFRPKFVMIKRSDSGNNWFILDTSRDTSNLANDQLLPNSSAAESTGSDCNIDILSNGFKLRTALDASNGSGGTYIYACFAENPYKYSLAR